MYFNVDFEDENIARLVQAKIEAEGYQTLLMPPMTLEEYAEERGHAVDDEDLDAVAGLAGFWTVLVKVEDSDEAVERAGAMIRKAASDVADGLSQN